MADNEQTLNERKQADDRKQAIVTPDHNQGASHSSSKSSLTDRQTPSMPEPTHVHTIVLSYTESVDCSASVPAKTGMSIAMRNKIDELISNPSTELPRIQE